MKQWIDEGTREKISILGSNFLEQLSEWVEEKNLPEFLGGGSSSGERLSENLGGWESGYVEEVEQSEEEKEEED